MKLILDIEEQTLENMQGYCKQNGIEMGDMIEKLFNKYIQSPANVIDELAKNNEMDNLEDFANLITKYLNEATYDIEQLAESKEAFDDDYRMVEIFKTINRDHVKNAFILTDLYGKYKKGIERGI